jgi:uncharacterized protein YndB with AHSA1/START domain
VIVMTETLSSIVATIEVDAPPEDVWPFLSEPRRVPLWLGCMKFTGRLGDVFYMQPDEDKRNAGDTAGATHCRLLEMREPELLRFSWYLPGTPETTVSIRVEPRSLDGSTVTLEHDGWDQFDAASIAPIRDALAGGWTSAVLPGLREAVESALEM